jgi:LmbE family N-acetylglucosaminyl deacetylase
MISKINFSRILILSPHVDDGEFGCGGTIAKLVEEGKDVFHAAFSIAEQSVPSGFPKNILELEAKKAAKVLGVKEKNLFLYKYEVRKLALSRQDVLEDLVKLKEKLKPDLIFMPSPNDLHQDHSTVSIEGLRAFKENTILGYELPWNNITFNTLAFIILDREHIKKKQEAVECFKSQSHRSYANGDFIRAWGMTRGIQIGSEFAETFEVLRWIIR